jgi:hypothetical protein
MNILREIWFLLHRPPEFCHRCGSPVMPHLTESGRYDPKTGDPIEVQFWSCNRAGTMFDEYYDKEYPPDDHYFWVEWRLPAHKNPNRRNG